MGDVSGAGTDSNVFLTMFGEHGDSGERKLLKSETHTDKFERGQEDIFMMEVVDLGKIHKLHVRKDTTLFNKSWFLDRIEVIDCETDEKFVFHCERWLAKGKDDGKMERSLYVVGYDGETSTKKSVYTSKSIASGLSGLSGSRRSLSLSMSSIPEAPVIPYTIKITTGNEPGSTCKSAAFIKIHGITAKKEEIATERIPLKPPNEKFRQGTAETFNIDAIDVGAITKIELGHVGVDSSWFVEELMIDQPTVGKKFTIPCKMWLARNKDDGLTTRTLNIEDAKENSYKAKTSYEVTLFTGDKPSAGADSFITLTLYGKKGNAPDQVGQKSDELGILLERGSTDRLFIDIDDIEPFRMIRLQINGKGSRPDWYCDKVEVRNLDSGKVTVFHCDGWLSKTKGDKNLSREISASVGGKSVLKKTTYKVTTKTSDKFGAGTGANVSCIVFGDSGDTGELHLRSSDTHKNKFERGNTDQFTFADKLALGNLLKLRVWHDNSGFSS